MGCAQRIIVQADKQLKGDLEFAKKTEEAYKRHERGELRKMSASKFLEKLGKES